MLLRRLYEKLAIQHSSRSVVGELSWGHKKVFGDRQTRTNLLNNENL